MKIPLRIQCGFKNRISSQILLKMKLTIFLLIVAFLQVQAEGYSQKITLSQKNAQLEDVFKQIMLQTDFHFVYYSQALQEAKPVDIELKNASLSEALTQCFKGQLLTYILDNNTVIVKMIPPPPSPIKGKVVDAKGNPLPFVSIVVKATRKGTSSLDNGTFSIDAQKGDVLVFSFIGFQTVEVLVGTEPINVILKTVITALDEVQVIGYGITTQRLSTGSIAQMKGVDIRKQPVENPMLALGGRLPGLQISQVSGLAGGPVSVTIRGKNSLGAAGDPLYIIDGVPFGHSLTNITSGSGISAQTLGGISSASSGTSPFVNLNPADIESMEVLKDADATAIYGSRGANGVILITTRKAKAGKTSVEASFYTGWGRPTRVPQMMNTEQYVMMRKEAFRNDNVIPNNTNATDLTVWDTTRYTNWTKMLIGEIARTNDAQFRLTGGNEQTQFLLSTGYHRETPIFYGNMHDDRINIRTSMNHQSNNKKFFLFINTSFSEDNNNINTVNIGQVINTIPNAPYPLDSDGNLVWRDKDINFSNPLAYIKKTYKGLTENAISNINIGYNFSKSFKIKVDAGMNVLRINQKSTNPTSSQSPYSTTPAATAEFFNQVQRNWIVEPQAEFSKTIGKSKFLILSGSSFQQQLSEGTRISASGYPSDELLGTPGPAATKSISSSYAKYRYAAVFGRISYNWDGKYLVNISGRRDGSSRFGPNKKFGNFGAIGLGWIFSEENFIKQFPFINHGKIRTSMGVTGNDRIGNYQYIARWATSTAAIPYQGVSGLYPTSLENPDFGWERNKKWEAAIELGLFNNMIFVNVDYYLNRTDNQLIGYNLPTQVGFTNVTANREALVQNSGWELMINTTNIRSKDLTWESSFNISIPKSELVAYPNLETSSYANVYIIGQPLTIRKYTDYQGVDPETGIYLLNGINLSTDMTIVRNLAQRYYGGLKNTLTYKGWSLDFFFHFVKQDGPTSIFFQAPGSRTNQTVEVLSRWQKPGDITDVQKFSTTGAPVTQYSYYANYSDARVTDASFIRLKNVSLSYEINRQLTQKLNVDNVRFYIQAQNLLTFTNYKKGDPETFSLTDTPLRLFTVGCQIKF